MISRLCVVGLVVILTTLLCPLVLTLPLHHTEEQILNSNELGVPLGHNELTQSSGRTFEMLTNAFSSMSMIPNLRNLFSQGGTTYQWVPLGSLIFGNTMGQPSASKRSSSSSRLINPTIPQ